MSTEHNPHESPNSVKVVTKPTEEVNPYWGKTSILDRYSSLGIGGKLRWVAVVFLAVNGIALLFGFFWPKMLIAGIVAFVVSFLIPSFIDD